MRDDDASNDGILAHDQLLAANVATQVTIDLKVTLTP